MFERDGSLDVMAWGLLALVTITGATWLSGQVGALIITGDSLPVGIGGALAALVRLVRHVEDPRGAWAPNLRTLLPGPVLYWTIATPIYLVAVSAVVTIGVRVLGRRRTSRRRFGVDTSAQLARTSDLGPLIVRRPVTGRLLIGRVGLRLLATEAPLPSRRGLGHARRGDRTSVLVIGPTRCGKTSNAIAGILEWDGPAILSSVKSDLLGATIDARTRLGNVQVFDPTGATGIESASWTPLRAAHTVSGAQKAARALADASPRHGAQDLDFFLGLGEQLLWPLLWTAANSQRTMRDVVRWVLTQDRPLESKMSETESFLIQIPDDATPELRREAEHAYNTLKAAWELDERTRSNVYATVQTMIRAWSDPGVANTSDINTIDLDWLVGGPNTLYVCAPQHEQARLATVFGGLVGDLIQQAFETAGRHNAPLTPTLIVLDEAGNTPSRWLPGVASTCAGIGIQLVTIWQSKAQIDAAYGRLADSVLTNHGTKIVFSGVSDTATLEYASRIVGDEDIWRTSSSIDVATGRRTHSHATHPGRLLPVHALRQARPGHALLIHGTLPPAHIRSLHPGRAAQIGAAMRQRVAGFPYKLRPTPGSGRRVTVKGR